MLFYGMLGVVVGGRLGYVLFYSFDSLLADPLFLFKITQGGMSFHGGLLGVMAAMWWFGRKSGSSFWAVADFVAPLVPVGLAIGASSVIIALLGLDLSPLTTVSGPLVIATVRPHQQRWLVGFEGIEDRDAAEALQGAAAYAHRLRQSAHGLLSVVPEVGQRVRRAGGPRVAIGQEEQLQDPVATAL